uniref:Uncharacterized protein n=1 Tax=Photinus pyralis TaxID=7054 RepID=A0A1Y1L328_PHOPY
MDEKCEDDINSGEDNNSSAFDSNGDSTESAKRLKTERYSSENSNGSSSGGVISSSSNAEDETENSTSAPQESTATASTSQGCLLRVCLPKTRVYRRYVEEDSPASAEVDSNDVMEESDHDGGPSTDIDTTCSTEIHDADVESDHEEHPVLKKPKPKHSWFMIPEFVNRQIGFSAKTQSSILFQRRCYGSLHCVQRLELMYKLDKHEGCVNSLNFHPNGELLASGSDDLKVVIWDWKYGIPLLTFETKHRGNVFQSKFLPLSGDLHIATCARDGQVRLAQVSTQEGVRSSRKLGSHKSACHKLAIINSQPHVILSAGEDGEVLLHDVRNCKPEHLLTVSSDFRPMALYSINSHPLSSYEFCVSGRDHIVRTYDQRKCGSEAVPLNSYFPKKLQAKSDDFIGLHVTCALYNHNGSEILASYNDEDIYTFDVNGTPGSYVRQFQGHRNGATIKGVNYFGPKSEFIVSGSDCGNLYIWEKNSEAIVNWMLADDSGVVNCLEPHPQLPFLCTSGLDFDVKVWVPSCESDPLMSGLSDTIKSNTKARTSYITGDLNDSHMLWILWRHLRTTSRINRSNVRGGELFSGLENTNSSSDSASSSDVVDSDGDSDEFNSSAGCTTS